MEQAESLRKLVAEFFEVDPGQIESGFLLAGKQMQGSLARAKLDAAIRRRLGVKLSTVYSSRTYGELEAAISGKAVSGGQPESSASLPFPHRDAAHSHVPRQTSLTPTISCGIDIELVDNLPQAKDYWEEEFYKTCFAPTEIAYCLTRENPRVHFAARWCVKEALKKCDLVYLQEEMANIEVALDPAGTPFISRRVNGVATRLPYAVSVSHTDTVAVAVVIHQPPNMDQPATRLDKTSTELVVEPKRRSTGIVPTVLSLIAIGLALWALIRAI